MLVDAARIRPLKNLLLTPAKYDFFVECRAPNKADEAIISASMLINAAQIRSLRNYACGDGSLRCLGCYFF